MQTPDLYFVSWPDHDNCLTFKVTNDVNEVRLQIDYDTLVRTASLDETYAEKVKALQDAWNRLYVPKIYITYNIVDDEGDPAFGKRALRFGYVEEVTDAKEASENATGNRSGAT